jgi:hypothetical protein
MNRLHLSVEEFASWDPRRDNRIATPACSVNDGLAVLKCGNGDGLVNVTAYTSEWHCPECVKQKKYKLFAY